MKKLIMLAAMLALVLAAAVPAIAQVTNELGQETESGEVAIEGSVESTGDYASQCVAPLQFGNTGNLQNGQSFLQYDSTSDDIEFEGSSFGFFDEPDSGLAFECSQAVQQSSAASSG